jgi:preprotein translocase subunit SecD
MPEVGGGGRDHYGWLPLEMHMKRLLSSAVLILVACSGLSAQRGTCPEIEVSVVAETPADADRSITLADGKRLFLRGTPLVTTVDVTGARASLTEGQYVLNIDVTAEAARRVQVFSERNVGRTMAVLVEGRLLRSPLIKDPIVANGFLIGAFVRADAERLADRLKGGCGPP